MPNSGIQKQCKNIIFFKSKSIDIDYNIILIFSIIVSLKLHVNNPSNVIQIVHMVSERSPQLNHRVALFIILLITLMVENWKKPQCNNVVRQIVFRKNCILVYPHSPVHSLCEFAFSSSRPSSDKADCVNLFIVRVRQTRKLNT